MMTQTEKIVTDRLGNTISHVLREGDDAAVSVQGEGDHPQTRRARARRALRAALGEDWDVTEYLAVVERTHVNEQGQRWGSMHTYATKHD